MQTPTLSKEDLFRLIPAVFPKLAKDRCLAILLDLPKNETEDNPDWRVRRAIAEDWFGKLQSVKAGLNLQQIKLIRYANVGSNNADLPEFASDSSSDSPVRFIDIFANTQLFLALTEYSTTAPLKIAAKKYGFRAATMPGFSPQMIPALKLDYREIGKWVQRIKDQLILADSCEVKFLVNNTERYQMLFDLRYNPVHISSGQFAEAGTAGNLPSGETYVVPFEGNEQQPSLTAGVLPLQLDDEVLLYHIANNQVTTIVGNGKHAQQELAKVTAEPAYGNIAELGFGVLSNFGVEPIGEVLLDEKLGFHIAFGRSDHFGGRTGPAKFSSPQAVIHLDRIYIPATQPKVFVEQITLNLKTGGQRILMLAGEYKFPA